jgi:thioredoxin 1
MKVLKFSASWCGPCKSLASTIETHYKGDVTIENVDIDENQEVAIKYGIRSVPTCVLLSDDDQELRRKSGAMMIDEFQAFIKG